MLELIESSLWQRLQDRFTHVFGVPIRAIRPSHELFTQPSWPQGLNVDQLVSTLRVGEELDQLVPHDHPPTTPSTSTTSLGVTYAAIPIQLLPAKPLAYFILGPMVVGSREDALQFSQRASALGLDAQRLWPLLISLKLYTFAGIRSAINLIEEVGGSLLEVACQARSLSGIAGVSKDAKDAAGVRTDSIASILLETAMLATRAEGGSVMLYDPREDALRLRAAQGLSDAVVASARLKRGEGLAGLAASRQKVLLVDREVRDAQIASRMKRPDLTSSLIAPLTSSAQANPIGVLNLRTTNLFDRFTHDHALLMQRLAELASFALEGIPLTPSKA